MIRLHQTFGAHAGRVMDFDRDVVRLGRLPDNDVVFDAHADLDASGRHAELRREGGTWYLVDVGSRNGTLLRGQRVTRHAVANGDEFEFGMGGPRVRVELFGGVSPGDVTGPATPIVQHPGLSAPPAGYVPPAVSQPPQGSAAPPGGAALAGGAAPPAYPGTPMPPSPFASGPPEQMSQPPSGHATAAEPKRYGERTVGLMIDAAVQQERQRKGRQKSTVEIQDIASQVARRSSRGMRAVIALVVVMMILVSLGVVALYFYERQREQAVRDESVRLQEQLADVSHTDTAARERIEAQLQELNEEIRAQQADVGSTIAEQNAGAVYLITVSDRRGTNVPVCSAFAVEADLLATNAHCVGVLERALGRGRDVAIRPNRGEGDPVGLVRMWRHPQYQAGATVPTPDVGLLRIDQQARHTVHLATLPELYEVRVGEDVFVLGFGADAGQTERPVAALSTGVVGRLTGFDGGVASPQARTLLSHSAFTDVGTNGSPVFDREGRVIAINAGNYRGAQHVMEADGPAVREGIETTYAWAVRADVMLQLLAGLRQQAPTKAAPAPAPDDVVDPLDP